MDATARFWGPDFFTDGGVLWKSFFVKKSFVGDGVMMVALHVSKAARTSGELLRNLCISSVRWGHLPTGSWNKQPLPSAVEVNVMIPIWPMDQPIGNAASCTTCCPWSTGAELASLNP